PTRDLFTVVGFGTRHTLASYLSMHPAPDTTASPGHFVSAPPGGPAAPPGRRGAPPGPARSTPAGATVVPFRNEIIGVPLFPLQGGICWGRLGNGTPRPSSSAFPKPPAAEAKGIIRKGATFRVAGRYLERSSRLLASTSSP